MGLGFNSGLQLEGGTKISSSISEGETSGNSQNSENTQNFFSFFFPFRTFCSGASNF